MSAAIMTNNIRVAAMAMGFGILAGVGTAYILFYNGLIVGALFAQTALVAGGRNIMYFWALILPHGVLELIAVFLAGSVGLLIGRGLLMPGDMTRKDALVKNARAAIALVPGLVILLIIAGLIEGFFTPMDVPPYIKLGFAGLTLVGFVLYCMRGVRAARRAGVEAEGGDIV